MVAATAIVLAVPGGVHAGAMRTSIRLSRSVPDMEATAVWTAPSFTGGATAGTILAAPGAILYGETLTMRQLSGVIGTALAVGGAQPVVVPAGTLFSAWWVGSERQACTSSAADPELPGKAAYQLCLTSRGGTAMDTAIVRKLGDAITSAVVTPLGQPVTLAASKAAPAEEGFVWPSAHVFSYRQDGGAGIIVEYNRALLAPEMAYERRVVVRKVAGATLTLRCEAGARTDMAKPLSAQKASFYKVAETDLDLASGAGEAILCGSRLDIARSPDGGISVRASAFSPWWALDDQHRDFRLGGEPFAYGAQAL